MENYDRLRVLWPDHLGVARGKYVPWRLADRGAEFCVGTFMLTYDRVIQEVEIGLDSTGFPDVHASYSMDDVRPCWEEGTAMVVADLEHDGSLYEVSARTALRRSIERWAELGYDVEIGIELEAFIMEPDGNGGWAPIDTPAGAVYGTGSLVDPSGLITEIMQVADLCDLPLESVNTEFDPPQWELTLEHADAMKACDDVFLFRQMAREIAAQHGLLLTFMGKPLADKAGSGMHVNFSLTARDSDKNAFNDPDGLDGLSEITGHCIAGILAHHEALTTLVAPTVNSYKRLQPGSLAGCWANWGHDHRCAAVRVPPGRGAATRIEQRTGDAIANPYLAVAAVIEAARLGVVANMECPAPEQGDGVEVVNTDRRSATNLGDALDDLEADKELVEAIGPNLIANFVGVKRIEWAQYCAAVTDWEINTYLHNH